MMDFSEVKVVEIPEGRVTKIESDGVLLWRQPLRFNQLVQNGNFESLDCWNVYSGTATVSNNIISVVGAVGRGGIVIASNKRQYIADGHKFFYTLSIKANVRMEIKMLEKNAFSNLSADASDNFITKEAIFTNNQTDNITKIDIFPHTTGEVGNFDIKNVMLIDLTEMYGAGNEPTTVDQLKTDCRSIGHDLDEYQPYTPILDVV